MNSLSIPPPPVYPTNSRCVPSVAFSLFALLLFALMVVGCGGGTSGTDGGGATKLFGRVLDASNGTPVSGASIRLKDRSTSALTDASGRFSLSEAITTPSIEIEILSPQTQASILVDELPLQPLEIELEIAVRSQTGVAEVRQKVVKERPIRPTPTSTPLTSGPELPPVEPTPPIEEQPTIPPQATIYDPTTDPLNGELARAATNTESTRMVPIAVAVTSSGVRLRSSPRITLTAAGRSTRIFRKSTEPGAGTDTLVGAAIVPIDSRFDAQLTVNVSIESLFGRFSNQRSNFRLTEVDSLGSGSFTDLLALHLQVSGRGFVTATRNLDRRLALHALYPRLAISPQSPPPTVVPQLPALDPHEILVGIEMGELLDQYPISSAVPSSSGATVVARSRSPGILNLRCISFSAVESIPVSLLIYSQDYQMNYRANANLQVPNGIRKANRIRAQLRGDFTGGFLLEPR